MARALTARLTRRTDPQAIEAGLEALWREAAREAPVARALMANLVVFRETAAAERVDLTEPVGAGLAENVAGRHPSRLIRIHHTRGGTAPAGPVDAAVALLLFGPPGARFGVEEIAVRSACAEASLPSIVSRLAIGDVPTSVWWMDDLSRSGPPPALVTIGRQLVYDSAEWREPRRGFRTLAALASGPYPPDLADLNWRRLAPMRRALTQGLRPALHHGAVRADRIWIRHRPGDSAAAWLLAGWLGSRLGWTTPIAQQVDVAEGHRGDEILSLSFGAADEHDLRASLNGHRVLVEYRVGAPFSLATPREGRTEAIAAELRALTPDACLHDALAALARP